MRRRSPTRALGTPGSSSPVGRRGPLDPAGRAPAPASCSVTPVTDARELLRERRVAHSIRATDFAQLGDRVREVMDAGARVIHVAVMDGHFVPPITIGPLIVDGLREQVHEAGGMLAAHLMIERPARQVAEFARAGADHTTVHFGATPPVHYAVKTVHDARCLPAP